MHRPILNLRDIYMFNHKYPEPFGDLVTELVGAVTELAEVAEPAEVTKPWRRVHVSKRLKGKFGCFGGSASSPTETFLILPFG